MGPREKTAARLHRKTAYRARGVVVVKFHAG